MNNEDLPDTTWGLSTKTRSILELSEDKQEDVVCKAGFRGALTLQPIPSFDSTQILTLLVVFSFFPNVSVPWHTLLHTHP